MKSIQESFQGRTIGVAFDLGTTTIVGCSVDRERSEVLGTLGLENPQSGCGRDIISRIEAVKERKELLAELSMATVHTLGSIIEDLARGARVAEVTVAGNSVMEHILLGLSPEPISRPPFRPRFKEARRLSAGDIGLDVAEGAGVFVFPLVGGFVGGDAVAVMLSLGLHRSEKTLLAIDIGTNSEIMLSSPKGVFATSAAAGPAFEGGEIGCGMRAVRGAVEGVRIEDGSLRLHVIGGVAPKGLCGSGLVSLVARLLDAGVIDRTGRIRDKDEVPGGLASRIREDEGGNSFVFFRGPDRELSLTQKDVRALQAAKSAIRAGINLLLKRGEVSVGQIEKVFVAGAFGSNLEKEELGTIGVLEKIWLDRTLPVGDAALEGARMALFSDEKKDEACSIARTVKYVALSGSRHFEREFLMNMNF